MFETPKFETSKFENTLSSRNQSSRNPSSKAPVRFCGLRFLFPPVLARDPRETSEKKSVPPGPPPGRQRADA